MSEKKIGWETYETIGISASILALGNPLIYVCELIRRNPDITAEQFHEVIEKCFECAPGREMRVLEILDERFPQYKDITDKIRIQLL